METAGGQEWFLRKHEDGNVFGPMSFAQLARWAASAQVAPHDSVSTDQLTWTKAPMLGELGMDWLVEVTSERYYGPTTLGAIHEFIRLGEVGDDNYVLNTCDGTRCQIAELAAELEPHRAAHAEALAAAEAAPAASGMSINVQDRIRDLEQSLREERRALHESEQRYRELEEKFRELVVKS